MLGRFVLILMALTVFTGMSRAIGQTQPATTQISVPRDIAQVVQEYLAAPLGNDEQQLRRAIGFIGDDIALGAAALRQHAPLIASKPGTYHHLKFSRGGRAWEYSIYLPATYDNVKKFPVLILPDLSLLEPEEEMKFWTESPGADQYVIFRPTILKYREQRTWFANQELFARDQSIAQVMRDALVHLRLSYAVDADRLIMTGFSQSGYYTYYFAESFPDDFAGIVPESTGGIPMQLSLLPLARNLASVAVRILHSERDLVIPIADAKLMAEAVGKAGGKAELITYTDKDYGDNLPIQRHPGPNDLRAGNVLPWGLRQKRAIPKVFTRTICFIQQGWEGRFKVPLPDIKHSTVWCSETNGSLQASASGVSYLVSPEDVAAKRAFRVGTWLVTPKPDLRLMLSSFKLSGDPGRMTAAQIAVTRP